MLALPQRARGADHPASFGREEARDLGADATGGAGHHHDLAVEPFHSSISLASAGGAPAPRRPAARTTSPINSAGARPAQVALPGGVSPEGTGSSLIASGEGLMVADP